MLDGYNHCLIYGLKLGPDRGFQRAGFALIRTISRFSILRSKFLKLMFERMAGFKTDMTATRLRVYVSL